MHSSAVIDDGTLDPGVLYLPADQLSGQPGTRAPHVALGPDHSTLDLFGREFVLLTPEPVEAPVPTHVVGYECPTLVRPDGIVGWRSRNGYDRAELEAALDTILAR